jgi:hypothetical protein
MSFFLFNNLAGHVGSSVLAGSNLHFKTVSKSLKIAIGFGTWV